MCVDDLKFDFRKKFILPFQPIHLNSTIVNYNNVGHLLI